MQPAPPKVDMTEPPQKEERRDTLEDPLARLPRIDMAYKIPPANSDDDDALTVLATILSSGRSSRFTEHIVRQKQLATTVFAGSDESRGPGLFNVVGTAAPGKAIADLEAAIEEEIEKVKTGPIADWEMDKARNGARNGLVSSLGSSLQRAVLLGQYALYYDNPDLINTRAQKIEKITAADVQRVAQKYLVKTGRTVVVTVPKAASAPRGGAR
jgi:predicted Zn-dependent peptidase